MSSRAYPKALRKLISPTKSRVKWMDSDSEERLLASDVRRFLCLNDSPSTHRLSTECTSESHGNSTACSSSCVADNERPESQRARHPPMVPYAQQASRLSSPLPQHIQRSLFCVRWHSGACELLSWPLRAPRWASCAGAAVVSRFPSARQTHPEADTCLEEAITLVRSEQLRAKCGEHVGRMYLYVLTSNNFATGYRGWFQRSESVQAHVTSNEDLWLKKSQY